MLKIVTIAALTIALGIGVAFACGGADATSASNEGYAQCGSKVSKANLIGKSACNYSKTSWTSTSGSSSEKSSLVSLESEEIITYHH